MGLTAPMAGIEVSTYVAVLFLGGIVVDVYAGSAKDLKNRHTSRESSVDNGATKDAYATWLAREKSKGANASREHR